MSSEQLTIWVHQRVVRSKKCCNIGDVSLPGSPNTIFKIKNSKKKIRKPKTDFRNSNQNLFSDKLERTYSLPHKLREKITYETRRQTDFRRLNEHKKAVNTERDSRYSLTSRQKDEKRIFRKKQLKSLYHSNFNMKSPKSVGKQIFETRISIEKQSKLIESIANTLNSRWTKSGKQLGK